MDGMKETKTLTVLIADDDPVICRMLEHALQKRQINALSADSIPAVEAALKTGKPDAALLDLVLGQDSGWEALSVLRRHSRIPVILMTGGAVNEETEKDARLLGAQAVVSKPFEVSEVVSLLLGLLGKFPPPPPPVPLA